MIVRSGLRFLVGALLVLSLAFAGTANAKSFSMTGSWYMNRGPLVDIPINGGPVLCIGGSLQTGCLGVFKAAGGGVTASTAISAMGANPAGFTIPNSAFTQMAGTQTAAVGLVPTVVQLVTSFDIKGPGNATDAFGAVPTFMAGQPAVFMKDAWSNDPGQNGGATPRAAADFGWCPGFGGPLCANGTSASPAGVEGIVKYTAGTNAFGGTMAMMLANGGLTSIIAGTKPGPTTMGTTMVPLLAHLPFGGAMSFMNPQVQGVGYAFNNSIALGSAPMYLGFTTSTGMGSGLITNTGPPATTMGFPMIVPGDVNVNWGFPWTTGTVTVANTELLGTVPRSTTLTAMGSDGRTAAGKGTITMVAGGTAHRNLSGQDFAAMEVVVLNFDDGTPSPSMGPAGLATVALLMALTAGYAIRGRFASAS